MLPLRTLLPALLTLALAAPASAQDNGISDPLQPLNRQIHALNDGLDTYLLRPISQGWEFITPQFLRDALRNFDDNITFPINAANDILQWKWRAAGEETARFGINTTIGILGFRDVASDWGLAKQDEDTGQTLGRWGIPPGPYLVLPILGPSNFRDGIGLIGDSLLSIYWIVAPWYVGLSYRSVDVVNRRAIADEDVAAAKAAALDYYVFLRNAYSQRRQALIRDMGAVETEDLYAFDDLYDFPEDEEEDEEDDQASE